MSKKVVIPSALRSLTAGAGEVEAEGATLIELIEDLEKRYPGIKERLLDEEGNLRRFINVYADREDVRFLNGLETNLEETSEISIIPAIAGGRT